MKNKSAVELGRLGGLKTSEAKRLAIAENSRKYWASVKIGARTHRGRGKNKS